MSNPYQSPQVATQPASAPGGVDREKLRRVAKYQQWVIYALLGNIVSNIISLAAQGQGLGVTLAVLALALAGIGFAMVSIFLLANELHSASVGVLCAILMIIPCISLIMLLILNGQATSRLQQNGIKVGFMGVNPDTI